MSDSTPRLDCWRSRSRNDPPNWQCGTPSDDIVEGHRITVYSQLAHTGRVEDTALVTDDAGKANPANLTAPGAGADIR